MAKNEMQKKKAREMLCDSLKQVAEEIDRVQKESTKIQYKAKQSLEEYFVQASSSAKVILNGKNNMVGRRDEREKMMTELTRGFSGVLKVIPIVGMGGIGKTTLAKEVFNDAFIRSHFDVRAWATISQEHNVKDILVSLLHSTKEKDDTVNTEDESKLADMLQKSLKSRRYLIVLDDMWSDKAWDDVRLCFPSENNGSRILLTTRNTEVACSAGVLVQRISLCRLVSWVQLRVGTFLKVLHL
uniref:Disease resistance protein BS2 n=1 Tax=Solanum tuberosum TaxID=4113 RepID=M0ZT66_SOLTU